MLLVSTINFYFLYLFPNFKKLTKKKIQLEGQSGSTPSHSWITKLKPTSPLPFYYHRFTSNLTKNTTLQRLHSITGPQNPTQPVRPKPILPPFSWLLHLPLRCRSPPHSLRPLQFLSFFSASSIAYHRVGPVIVSSSTRIKFWLLLLPVVDSHVLVSTLSSASSWWFFGTSMV